MNTYGCWLTERAGIDIATRKLFHGHYQFVDAHNVLFAAKQYVDSIKATIDVCDGEKVSVRDETGYIHTVKVVNLNANQFEIIR